MKNRVPGRAFTIVELIAVVVVVVLLLLVLLRFFGRAKATQPALQDSTCVRGIHQGMVLWAQNNSDVYPLPSLIDSKDLTVADQGAAKDTTANIMSMLIYNGFFSPELCVSAAEVNTSIRVCGAYNYVNPPKATRPVNALWDPAFSTDFSGGKTGNFSYAHMLPADARLKNDWKNTFSATTAAIGNRGPEIKGTGTGPNGERLYVGAPSSNTYLIHSKTDWKGNIAYNDNHVMFESRWDPTNYKDAAGKAWTDCLFYDEPDDPSGRNNYLGNFIKAGATGAEFKPIWD